MGNDHGIKQITDNKGEKKEKKEKKKKRKKKKERKMQDSLTGMRVSVSRPSISAVHMFSDCILIVLAQSHPRGRF